MSESKTCDRDAVSELLNKPVAASGFRAELRRAREACQRDSEAFDEILFSLERLGCFLRGEAIALGAYKCCLCRLVATAGIFPSEYFEQLFKSVKDARNDALHQGSVARHLSSRLIEIALILEESLGSRLTTIEYLMVKQPVVAEDWQTVAMIRQTMLANAFSYLPYKKKGKWVWISDYALASHLRELTSVR